MHNIILSNTISNYTIHHIKSSIIIKWLTVIQTKWEREWERKRITNRNTNRLRECVCVIFFHDSVVLFYSSILLLWYIGYDDFISMNNVFVFVLIIIILLLVLSLANMKMNILEKSPFSISYGLLYFSL